MRLEITQALSLQQDLPLYPPEGEKVQSRMTDKIEGRGKRSGNEWRQCGDEKRDRRGRERQQPSLRVSASTHMPLREMGGGAEGSND